MARRRRRTLRPPAPLVDWGAPPPPRTDPAASLPYAQRVEMAAKEFFRMLRQIPGLNVRQPSHHEAPFRGLPIAYTEDDAFGTLVGSLADPITVWFPITWTGSASPNNSIGPALLSANPLSAAVQAAEPFPDGHIGVVPREGLQVAIVQEIPTVASGLNAWRNGRWTAYVGGRTVTGLQDVRPYSLWGDSNEVAGAPGTIVRVETAIKMDTRPLAPIQLRAGETMVIGCFFTEDLNVAGQNFRCSVNLRGWRYPVAQEEPSIYGTLVD